MNFYEHSYLSLYRSGELAARAETLRERLRSCDICPLDCKVNRLEDEISRCYTGVKAIVSSHCAHFGEEPLLVGTNGVGNIFFGNCNLRCVYCQNYEISQRWREEKKNEVTDERLAEMMLELEAQGCHAIGFVSPTHIVPQIVSALVLACEQGLRLPLIYNTNSYDDVSVLQLLDGIIDIYLPDIKYASDAAGYEYSKVKNYFTFATLALKEMYRQVGAELVIGDDGLIKRGLIIRHLVLPNDIAESDTTFSVLKKELTNNVTISLMSQYYPTNRVNDEVAAYDEAIMLINRTIRQSEYEKVLGLLEKYGFENGWAQEFESEQYYRPNFKNRREPFTK